MLKNALLLSGLLDLIRPLLMIPRCVRSHQSVHNATALASAFAFKKGERLTLASTRLEDAYLLQRAGMTLLRIMSCQKLFCLFPYLSLSTFDMVRCEPHTL